MAEFKLGLNAQNAEQCRQILAHLPGVFAAGLRFDEEQLQRAHLPGELTAALTQAGFADVRIYGDRTFEPPLPEEKRIHITAVRPKR